MFEKSPAKSVGMDKVVIFTDNTFVMWNLVD